MQNINTAIADLFAELVKPYIGKPVTCHYKTSANYEGTSYGTLLQVEPGKVRTPALGSEYEIVDADGLRDFNLYPGAWDNIEVAVQNHVSLTFVLTATRHDLYEGDVECYATFAMDLQ